MVAPKSGKPSSARKRWQKKTPIDVVLEQGEKMRAEVEALEHELETKRRQLEKFEQAQKLLESD